MKRTFLVEIEADDDADNARPSDEFFYDVGLGEIPATVVPVEVTAVHAKEREVIAAAIAQLVACEKNDRWIDSTTHVENVARELRALMEGKA